MVCSDEACLSDSAWRACTSSSVVCTHSFLQQRKKTRQAGTFPQGQLIDRFQTLYHASLVVFPLFINSSLLAQALKETSMDVMQESAEQALEALFISHLQQRNGSCLMSELGGSSAWKTSPINTGLKGQMLSFINARRHIFYMEEKNNTQYLRLAEFQHEAPLPNSWAQTSSIPTFQKPKVANSKRSTISASFVEHLLSLPHQGHTCDMQDLAMLPAWMSGSRGCGKLKKFLDERPELFAVTPRNHSFDVSLVQNGSRLLMPSYTDTPSQSCSADTPPDISFARSQRQPPKQPNTAPGMVRAAIITFLNGKANRACDLAELATLPQWLEWTGRPKLKTFIKDLVILETMKKARIVVRLRPFYFTQQTITEDADNDFSSKHEPAQELLATSSYASASVVRAVGGHKPQSGGVLFSEPPPFQKGEEQDSSHRLGREVGGTVVNLASIEPESMVGQTLLVQPLSIRWTHDRLQQMFTCGRRLKHVADQLRDKSISPEVLPMIEIVSYQGKWYSRNNRRLWCFKEAGLRSIQARVGPVDAHFLKGLTTATDGWSVDFYPPCICSRCGIEFPNKKGVRWHTCKGFMQYSALDWDDQASEASEASEGSEIGDYGEDGCWYSDAAWSQRLETDEYWQCDAWGRDPLWRAAASGNHQLASRLLEAGADVDACDCEGVSPLLAAVRRGQWYVAELLLQYGAYEAPWKWTARKGKKWSSCRATRYDRIVAAVKSGRSISGRDLIIKCKPKSKAKSKPKSKAKAKASKAKR